MTERESAIGRILAVLRSRLALLSPSYGEALEQAEQHGITVSELLAAMRKKAEEV